MGKTSDQLREEIAAKRDDAAEKIDLIEAKVQDLPSLAKDSVKETVDQQLAQARGIVQDKVGQVKQRIDVPTQVSERPLAALGVAFAGGYLIGKALGGDRNGGTGRGYRADWQQAHSRQSGHIGSAAAGMGMGMGIAGGYDAGQQHTASTPPGSGAWSGPTAAERAEWERHAGRQGGGVMDALRDAARSAGLDDTLASLTGALVTTLTDQFHRTLQETFPEFARHLEEQGGLGAKGGQSATGSGRDGGRMTGAGSLGGADMGSHGAAYGADRRQFGQDLGAAAEGARTYGQGQSESQSWKQGHGHAGGSSFGSMPGDGAADRGANI